MSSKFNKLASHIPAAYQPQVNTFVKALLQAWGESDDAIEAALQQCKDQIFVETASERYLDRLGSNVGVERPTSVGINDQDFRGLIEALSYAPKQVRSVIWKLLEVFYQSEAIYANFLNSVAEPYALVNGQTLKFFVDESELVEVTFRTSDFLNISTATAIEVANAINKQLIDSGIVALEYYDGITKKTYIRIRTKTAGSTGSIRLAGGSAQNVLKFPQLRATAQTVGTQWDIAPVTGDTVRIEWTGVGNDPDLQLLSVGDLAIIGSPFNAANRGSFVLYDVVLSAIVDGITPGKKYTGKYIELHNSLAFAQTVTQTSSTDITFSLPKKYDISAYPRPAIQYEVTHKELIVIMPSTVTIINRDLTGSAHLHPNTDMTHAFLADSAGLNFIAGEDVVGSSAMYLAVGANNFVPGDTVSGAAGSAKVTHVLTNLLTATVLLVKSVVGTFTLGEVITGSISGATRRFSTLISTSGATTTVDAVIEQGVKLAITTPSGVFLNGEGVIGRTQMFLKALSGTPAVLEAVTSGMAMYLVAPWGGTIVAGMVLTGSVSGATATVNAVLQDKVNGQIVLQVTMLPGPAFSVGEFAFNGVNGGVVSQLVTASGATAVVKTVDWSSTENGLISLQSINGVFKHGEIMVFGTTGFRAIAETMISSAAVFSSIKVEDDFLSPYVFDNTATFSPSDLATTTNQSIVAGSIITSLACTSLPLLWPATSGYFMLEYGSGNQEGPIRYIYKPNANLLLVDPAYVFTKSHSLGASIRFIRSLEPTKPRSNGQDYAAYVTGLAVARTTLQELVRACVAAGVVVRFIITYPEYRWSCYNTNDTI